MVYNRSGPGGHAIPDSTPIWEFNFVYAPWSRFYLNGWIRKDWPRGLGWKTCDCVVSGHVPAAARPLLYIVLIVLCLFVLYVYETSWMIDYRERLCGQMKHWILICLKTCCPKFARTKQAKRRSEGAAREVPFGSSAAAVVPHLDYSQESPHSADDSHHIIVAFERLPFGDAYSYVDGSPADFPGMGMYRLAVKFDAFVIFPQNSFHLEHVLKYKTN